MCYFDVLPRTGRIKRFRYELIYRTDDLSNASNNMVTRTRRRLKRRNVTTRLRREITMTFQRSWKMCGMSEINMHLAR